MLSREELFDKFLTFLQTEQTPLEYLGAEPEAVSQFDPYQMVGEWIALRHEIKQQGKLLHSAQEALQQSLSVARADKEQLQNRLEQMQQDTIAQHSAELTAQKKQFEREQESLLRELLGVLDALERACAHWQEELETPSVPTIEAKPAKVWQRLTNWFASMSLSQTSDPQTSHALLEPSKSALTEVLVSNQQGLDLIRRTLLDVLKARQVVPIVAQGQPFDPQQMYAVGQQENQDAPENTVFQEIVRGYTWGDRMLREAQVIVTVKPGN
jgi:molecular chaperone GrpE